MIYAISPLKHDNTLVSIVVSLGFLKSHGDFKISFLKSLYHCAKKICSLKEKT